MDLFFVNDIQLPDSLKQHLTNGDVIPLIGAGVSMSIRTKEGKNAFPSWPELLSNAAKKLADENQLKESQLVNLLVELNKYQEAAKAAYDALSGSRWYEFINSQFAIDFTDLDDAYKALPHAIWQLSNRIVTLNYDKVLEWAHIESANICAFDNTNGAKLVEFTRNNQQNMLWHLHGKIDVPKHIVLTPQSYHRLYLEDAEEHYKAALAKFRDLICSKTLLFIGCSLDDAELLAEIAKQNELFDGNTGPHYALVRERDKQTIEAKLADTHVNTIVFSEFGEPLIDAVRQFVKCKVKQELQQIVQKVDVSPQEHKQNQEQFDKIGLFIASPLDKPINYSEIIAKFKKIKHPICQEVFTASRLIEADDFSILFFLAKITSSGLLIEDDNACSDYISISDLEEILPVNAKIAVLITDRFLSEQELQQVNFPLLVLPLLNNHSIELKTLDKLAHQLFKKPDVKHFIDKKEIQSVQVSSELLISLNPENYQLWTSHRPIIPRDINSSELKGFTGRLSDLADISQKLAKAKNAQRLLTIKGSGGLGKTTIAKKVALELACRGQFNAGVYFIDCENISSANQLEMHIAEAFNLRNTDDLFGYLARHHDQRSRLLIFDNVESLLYLKQIDKNKNKQFVEKVKELLSLTLIYASVLVTSREIINAEWEDVIPFRQMESEEALALFNNLTKNGYFSEEEQDFARKKILEPLLNNNPLAIKLICDGMPKGKNLKELKRELEEDFFGKVKEDDLILMFDDKVDSNINRQESLYVSILYSYQTLSESQKRTFESFSLFPDGIDLDTFKRLVAESKKNNRHQEINKFNKPISDKDILVLSNKSLVEDYDGFYTLQSVIQRFARFQFDQHMLEKDKLELFRQALNYNQQLMCFIDDLRDTNKKAIPIFLSIFNNLLSAVNYGAKKNVISSELELENYFRMLHSICDFSSFLNLSSDFLNAMRDVNIENLINLNTEQSVCLAWEIFEIYLMYYNGEFDTAFNQLNKLISKESLMAISANWDKGNVINSSAYFNANKLYSMEGDVLNSLLHDIKFNRYTYLSVGAHKVQMAMSIEPLLGVVLPDLHYFEALSYSNEGIDHSQLCKVINDLHENEHLERISLTYIKSRDFHVSHESIDKLVNVNPYTRGLKKLMYAFIHIYEFKEINYDIELCEKIDSYYKSALPDLFHIKFYYMQALYFYAQFLKLIASEDFEDVYSQGLELTRRYHYRYWQHKFLLLEQPNLGRYKPENYPLPSDPDASVLIEKQAKWIKKRYGSSLNPFN